MDAEALSRLQFALTISFHFIFPPLAMGLGLFAPPFGVGYYAACAIGKVDPTEGIRPIWGYLVALVIGLILVAAVPWFSIGFI